MHSTRSVSLSELNCIANRRCRSTLVPFCRCGRAPVRRAARQTARGGGCRPYMVGDADNLARIWKWRGFWRERDPLTPFVYNRPKADTSCRGRLRRVSPDLRDPLCSKRDVYCLWVFGVLARSSHAELWRAYFFLRRRRRLVKSDELMVNKHSSSEPRHQRLFYHNHNYSPIFHLPLKTITGHSGTRTME